MADILLNSGMNQVPLNANELDTITVPSDLSGIQVLNGFEIEDVIDLSAFPDLDVIQLFLDSQEIAPSSLIPNGGLRLVGSFGQIALLNVDPDFLSEGNFIF